MRTEKHPLVRQLAAGDFGNNVAHLFWPGDDILPFRLDRNGPTREMPTQRQVIFPPDISPRIARSTTLKANRSRLLRSSTALKMSKSC